MPTIVAETRVTGLEDDPTPSTEVKWTMRIDFSSDVLACPNSPRKDPITKLAVQGRTINVPQSSETTLGGSFTVPPVVQTPAGVVFTRDLSPPNVAAIRGGELTLAATATVNGVALEART